MRRNDQDATKNTNQQETEQDINVLLRFIRITIRNCPTTGHDRDASRRNERILEALKVAELTRQEERRQNSLGGLIQQNYSPTRLHPSGAGATWVREEKSRERSGPHFDTFVFRNVIYYFGFFIQNFPFDPPRSRPRRQTPTRRAARNKLHGTGTASLSS
jgi:Fe-S-cluster formation regulator IscX/YfhJ